MVSCKIPILATRVRFPGGALSFFSQCDDWLSERNPVETRLAATPSLYPDDKRQRKDGKAVADQIWQGKFASRPKQISNSWKAETRLVRGSPGCINCATFMLTCHNDRNGEELGLRCHKKGCVGNWFRYLWSAQTFGSLSVGCGFRHYSPFIGPLTNTPIILRKINNNLTTRCRKSVFGVA